MTARTSEKRLGDARPDSMGNEEIDMDAAVEVFKALGHPVRLDIMKRMVRVPELACTELEHTLPIAKTTISYHIKILHRAGLIEVRKEGRFYFYRSKDSSMDEFVSGLTPLLETRLK